LAYIAIPGLLAAVALASSVVLSSYNSRLLPAYIYLAVFRSNREKATHHHH